MSEALIIDACRTPRGIGKYGKGALSEIHPQQLGASVLKALADRTGIDTGEVDDIVCPCPLVPTLAFLREHDIDLVVHGFADETDAKKQDKTKKKKKKLAF